MVNPIIPFPLLSHSESLIIYSDVEKIDTLNDEVGIPIVILETYYKPEPNMFPIFFIYTF